MNDRVLKIIFAMILSLSVVLGGFLAYRRHLVESDSRTVELAMDWRDLGTLAALSRYPMDKLLDEVHIRGITSIGLFEETLEEASSLGELYFASGSGIIRFKEVNPVLAGLVKKNEIKPERSYLLCFNPEVRKRVERQLGYAFPKTAIRNLGAKVIEIDESAIRLRDLTVGISDASRKYLAQKGFSVVPRMQNDPRYDVSGKISELAGYNTIIFDGDEILGYPDRLPYLALAMRSNHIKYGNVEIVKQDGDRKLKELMGDQIVRVHSIPKDELLKINKDEALVRFTRAVRERSIRLVYIRPFLPPQINEDPVSITCATSPRSRRIWRRRDFCWGRRPLRKISSRPAGWWSCSVSAW